MVRKNSVLLSFRILLTSVQAILDSGPRPSSHLFGFLPVASPAPAISFTGSTGMFPSTSATAPRFLLPFTTGTSRRAMAAAATDPQQQPPPKAVRVKVKGHVQGVFFRDWTVKMARSLGLDGWVRNRRDGTVEALFSGDPAKVDEMVSTHLPEGPPTAIVTAVVPWPAELVDPADGFQWKPTA
jgi:acylphosphatase